MNGKDILKWGFLCWLGYNILKEFGQPANDVNHNNSIIQVPYVPETSVGHKTMYPARQPFQPARNSLTDLDISKIFEEAFNQRFGKPLLLEPQTQSVKLIPDAQTVEAGNWLRLIHHPSVIVILGGRGKGKSALGYRLLEYLRWTASPYVVGLPGNARKLLPDWVGMAVSLEDVPPKAIILVDEAYMPYHARSSMAAEAKAMSQMVNLSRQREQTLIFVSQEARQVDKNVASSANVVVFKDLGILQLEFDRRELNKIATQAKQAFSTVHGDKRRYAYIYAPDNDFMGLVENSLPSFWNEKLSHVFAVGGEIIARPPKKTPLEQRIEKVKQLKQQGLSLGQIAKLMGVSKGTVKNWLEDYPYKR
jgi:hypothetical protein